MQDQLIAVFVAVVAEPLIRFIKGKFNLDGAAMLLVAGVIAALGAAGIVLYLEGVAGLTLEAFLNLLPTIFAVGQLIFAATKIARGQ